MTNVQQVTTADAGNYFFRYVMYAGAGGAAERRQVGPLQEQYPPPALSVPHVITLISTLPPALLAGGGKQLLQSRRN